MQAMLLLRHVACTSPHCLSCAPASHLVFKKMFAGFPLPGLCIPICFLALFVCSPCAGSFFPASHRAVLLPKASLTCLLSAHTAVAAILLLPYICMSVRAHLRCVVSSIFLIILPCLQWKENAESRAKENFSRRMGVGPEHNA